MVHHSRVVTGRFSFSESVIREMTRLAQTYSAINLAQGFPDFPAPSVLKQAACQAITQDYNQYAVTWGAPGLRAGLSRRLREYNGIEYDEESEITVTCGSTEAMIASLLALTKPGDEVLIPEPFYENYGPDSIISGARPRFIPAGKDWSPDLDALTAAFSSSTRAIVLNSPNNPSGKVYGKEILRTIADLCEDFNAIAICDEIYEHILFDGHEHVSMACIGDMHDRTVTIGSFSKTYSVTGWRVGYAAADAGMSSQIRKVHDFLTVGAPAPLQHACITALDLPDSYYSDLAREYDRKRMILYKGLENAGFGVSLPEGAYYILADAGGFGMDDTSFAGFLVREIGVAAVPGSSFFHDGPGHFVRFTFSKEDATLVQACSRLSRLKDL